MRRNPRTRAQAPGVSVTAEIDPATGRPYQAIRSKSGRIIDKNRSEGWRGYKSHLSKKQKRLIRWALRQRDRGCTRESVWIKLQEHWEPGPMQYPLTQNTIASWELTRAAERSKGREWPADVED